MTDTPAPTQTEPPKSGSAPPAKKEFLDKPVVKFALMLMGFLAPVPMLIVLLSFWAQLGGPTDTPPDPFLTFRDIINGTNSPPTWLAPLAFVPSLLLIAIIFRNAGPRLAAFGAMFLFAAVEVVAAVQFADAGIH